MLRGAACRHSTAQTSHTAYRQKSSETERLLCGSLSNALTPVSGGSLAAASTTTTTTLTPLKIKVYSPYSGSKLVTHNNQKTVLYTALTSN